MRALTTIVALLVPVLPASGLQQPLSVLPSSASARLVRSLDGASRHASHAWRDTPATNPDGTVNAYIEIPRGERRKWEFDIAANARAIDRVLPREVGPYPVNYGYVPQTISYDGDPFDALVLGPPLAGGRVVRGVIVGVMFMEDEKGLDSKVVLSEAAADGRPRYQLTDTLRQEIGGYFRRYKRHEAGKFSKVPGWGSAPEGLAYVRATHAFFRECRDRAGAECRLSR